MTPSRIALVSSSLALALFCGAAQAQPAPGGRPMTTLQMPATPEPARVTLDPKTTALIVLDYVEGICSVQPSCRNQMLPAMIPFLERVRKAGLVVAYGTRERNMAHWIREVAPLPGDIRVNNTAQDRFFRTDLDKMLKEKGIKTLIMVGWKISGSVTYTAVAAMAHEYTVVIPTDTTSAGSGYETTIGFYNVLNSGNANLANEALKPMAVTLTRTDLVAFQ
jgi:nicotinamidase-related amidase